MPQATRRPHLANAALYPVTQTNDSPCGKLNLKKKKKTFKFLLYISNLCFSSQESGMTVTEPQAADCLSRVLTAQTGNCCSFPGRGKRIFCSRERPDRFWGRSQPSVKSVPGVFCGVTAAGAQSYHPFSARTKNVRRCLHSPTRLHG